MPTAEIAPRVEMPMIGLGTWSLKDPYHSVRTALDVGYRHIDTAEQYGNEDLIGRAIADSGLPREDVFITTKILSRDVDRVDDIISASLAALRTDYVDLWLIHDPPPPGLSERLWGSLIRLREAGFARAIGVSEYGTSQIDAIIASSGVTPAVNQVRWAPALFDPVRLRDTTARGIRLEGFSGLRLADLDDLALVAPAQRRGVTPAQILLRWHIDHGVVAIPRTDSDRRIEENLDVWGFELDEDERRAIDALSTVRVAARACGPGCSLVGRVGTVVAPTGVPTGPGEIAVEGQLPLIAWSSELIAVGSIARIVGCRSSRSVDVVPEPRTDAEAQP